MTSRGIFAWPHRPPNNEVHRRPTAFTLIELLVTVAIIGILSSLLLSGIARSKAKARSISCQQQLRQWGIGLFLYAGDHDDQIPRRGQGSRPIQVVDRAEDWFNALPPLLDLPSYNQRIQAVTDAPLERAPLFDCPSTRASTNQPPDFSYGMNIYLSPWIEPQPHRLQQFRTPANVPFLADGGARYSATVPSAHEYSVNPRHHERANLVFLDGHVQSYRSDYLGCGVGDPERPDIRWFNDIPGGVEVRLD